MVINMRSASMYGVWAFSCGWAAANHMAHVTRNDEYFTHRTYGCLSLGEYALLFTARDSQINEKKKITHDGA